MQGLRGNTRAGFRVINGKALRPLLPTQETRRSLAEIAENMAAAHDVDGDEFDVFISHAGEDKDAVVRPLAHALRSRDLSVWCDEFELRIGDSLRRKIDAGISRSSFGHRRVVHAFFAKGWPQYELHGLVTMSVSGRQVLLPVWHNISRDEVVAASPSLADKVALRTSDYGVDEIADEIASVVTGE